MELTAHHLFVQTVVAVDADMVEVCLRTLGDAHLQVDGVANDVHLDGVDIREDVAIVVVVVACGIVVFPQALVDVLLVIDISLFHAQHGIQIVGGDHGVAHPGDVADEILVALVDFHIDVHVLVVVLGYRVFDDGGIAEAQLVVLVDQCLLGFLIAFVSELLGLEHRIELACFVDLAERTLADQRALDLAVLQLVVALEDQFVDLHLRLLVDVDVEDNLSWMAWIVDLRNVDLGILVSLLVEVSLSQNLGTVDDVTRQTHASHHSQFGLHIVALGLFDAVIDNLANAGTQTQVDAEVYLGSDDRVGSDAHLREQTIAPVALDGFSDLGTRHFDLLTYLKSRETCEHIVLVAFHTFYGDSGNLTGTGCACVGDVGIDDLVLSRDG